MTAAPKLADLWRENFTLSYKYAKDHNNSGQQDKYMLLILIIGKF